MDITKKFIEVWSRTADVVCNELSTSMTEGLTVVEVEIRQKEFGLNDVVDNNGQTYLQIFLRQFSSPLIFVLMIAVVATMILQEWVDASIILLAILVNAALGFYQENRAEHAIEALRSFITVRTRVIRDGLEREIDAHFVVPGDIVHLTLGSRVPADGRLLTVQHLKVDEAILTGESLPVEKSLEVLPGETTVPDRVNMVFGGTLVTEGSGLMVVTATGMSTEFGQIAQLALGTKREHTPLQKTVAKFAWFITIVIAILVVGVFFLGVARGESWFDMFLVSIAVAVGAIPEALPIGLTAVLAVGVERLAKRRGIMRSLTAAETLGSTTLVITDKTGTLTEAKLQLMDIYTKLDLELLTDNQKLTDFIPVYSKEQRDLLRIAVLGSDVVIENPLDIPDDWKMTGSAIETTLVRSAARVGLAMSDRGMARPFQSVIPFSSSHKFSVSAGMLRTDTNLTSTKFGYAYIVIGAPDILLQRTTLSLSQQTLLLQKVEQQSELGKRIVGVAVQYINTAPGDTMSATPTEIMDLEFLGVVTFQDPVREEVPDAIKKIQTYGVRVVMATGDLPGTAAAVGRQLGWNIDAKEMLTGTVLETMSDEELTAVLPNIKIFTRVTPADKLRIAKLFQVSGEVVAMTGDGVNDAPSLKAVDIGIAVGSGSDVAKGVADLILLDDNFNTIVCAIEEGKRVLANIRKTFVYLMSNSLDEIILIGGSLLLGLSLPLTAMQIIWVNFFTGSLPAIAFAFDTQGMKVRESSHRRVQIINLQVKLLTLIVGVVTSVLLFVLYYILSLTALDAQAVKTFIFACFSTYILVIAFSFRHLSQSIFSYNPFSNKVLNVGVIIGLTLTVLTIYVPFLQSVFNTVALNVNWWIGVCSWLLFSVVFVEVIKWVGVNVTHD